MNTRKEKMRRFLSSLPDYHTPLVGFFAMLVLYGVVFRARLGFFMLFGETTFISGAENGLALAGGILEEFVFAFLVVSPVLVFGLFRKRSLERPGKISLLVMTLLLFLLGFLYGIHYRMTISLGTGLSLDHLREVISANSFFAMKGDVPWYDYVFILLLPALYWLNLSFPKGLVRGRNMLLGGLLVIGLAATLLSPLFPRAEAAVSRNPFLYTALDIGGALSRTDARSVTAAPVQNGLGELPASVVPGVTEGRRPEKPGLSPSGKRWNFLFIVMESTGSDYVFDETHGNKMPMPFLKQLSERSLYMTNHYSPANTSPRSLFSIFSGVLPSPVLEMFVTRRNVRIPSLLSFLGPEYSSFLVTPGALSWFFPRGFFKNSGMNKLYGYKALPKWTHGPNSPANGRNESKTVDFFLKKLNATEGPFLGVYYSYIAHWPYHDYGRKYDVFYPQRPAIPRQAYRYYNNLRLMDTLIEKIYRDLEKSGRLENTVLVITGDHGQAFGKHRGNWIHSRASFNENFRTPLIIHQPELFTPRRVGERTNHTDILPTLLDSLGIAYHPGLLQGESLHQSEFRRKYNFLYGNERTLSSISRENIKLQLSLRNGRCWVYDLNLDPDERNKIRCGAEHDEQKYALLKYKDRQRKILKDYNRSLKTSNEFRGASHPGLAVHKKKAL